MLDVLVGVDGTVTGGEMGIFAEDKDEETFPPAVVVKGVMGMEVEEAGGAVVLEVTELLSGLENAVSPPMRQRPRGEMTNGG